MREYGRVSPQFWIGRTGKLLRKSGVEAQLVALYLVSSPHANMLGLYYLPEGYIAHETGLSPESASRGLRACIEAGFCDYDADRELVWVFEMARFQIADSLAERDKRSIGIFNELAKMPRSILVDRFVEKYGAAFHLPSNLVRPSEAPSKGDQSSLEAPSKPGTGAGAGTGTGKDHGALQSPAGGNTADHCPHQAIIELYHQILPMGVQVRIWNDGRASKLRTRWREDEKRQNLDWWRKFFEYIARSDFLTGKVSSLGRKPFQLSLHWIVVDENFAKIIEGNYDRAAA